MRNVKLSTDHGFSVFQHATHTKVVLDTAWPWASEAYGLCRLCAYFCSHKLIRARSYGLTWAIRCYSPNRASSGALAANKNELAARAFESVSVLVLVSADCARCGGAVFWLHRLRTFLFQPVACQQVVGFCLAIWAYAVVIFLGVQHFYMY